MNKQEKAFITLCEELRNAFDRVNEIRVYLRYADGLFHIYNKVTIYSTNTAPTIIQKIQEIIASGSYYIKEETKYYYEYNFCEITLGDKK